MSEKKKTMRAVIEIIIAVLVIIAVYFIIRGMDRHDVRIQQAATENETQRVWKEFQEKTVSIKLHKKTWKFAHPVQTYLFIGTDKSGNEDAEGEEYHGSMADALMLVVVDEEEKAYGILQLNRDTITEVPMLLQDGSANASAQMQIHGIPGLHEQFCLPVCQGKRCTFLHSRIQLGHIIFQCNGYSPHLMIQKWHRIHF